MAEYQLAQLNIATLKFSFESPEMAGSVDRLEGVNALADAAPGFVWRLQLEDDDLTPAELFGAGLAS